MDMKGLNEIRFFPFLSMISAVLIFAGCVNEEYDLEKEIDMNVTVLKDVALPLGSFEKVTLDKLLDFAGDNEMLEIDPQGNIAIRFNDNGKALTQTVTVPALSIDQGFQGAVCEAYIGDFYIAYDSSWDEIIGELIDVTKPREFPNPLSIEFGFVNDEFPDQIKEIGYVEVDATAHLNLSVRDRKNNNLNFKVFLAEGTQIQFPEWIVFGEIPAEFSNDRNVLTLKEDILFHVGSDADSYPQSFDFRIVGLDTDKLPEGQGVTSDGKLLMNDFITLKGLAYLDISELQDTPPVKVSPVISTNLNISDMQINSVEVLFSDDVDIDLVSGLSPVQLGNIPDFLSSNDIVLDLADVRLDIDLGNTSPFSGTLSAAIESYDDDKVIATKSLGPIRFDGAKDGVPAYMRWSFSEGTLTPPEGYLMYEIPGLTDLIECMPKYVRFKDFDFALDEEFVKIVPGAKYEFSENYSIYAPIAFGPEFRLPYKYNIEDIGFEFSEVSVPSAQLELEVESTVPLEFSAEAVLLDGYGMRIDGLEVNIIGDSVLKAGTLESPALSNLILELKVSEETGLSFDGLELSLNASAPAAGVNVLNVNQGLHVKSIVVRMPDGVSMNVNE